MMTTCIYINVGLRDTLNQAARKLGLSRNALAQALFSRVMKEKRLGEPKIFSRVKYQNPDPAKEWKSIGIDLAPDMFERCQDLRKVLKMSVSLILAYAIRTYLQQIISEHLEKPAEKFNGSDNYTCYYSIQRIFSSETDGFIIRWTKNHPKSTPIP